MSSILIKLMPSSSSKNNANSIAPKKRATPGTEYSKVVPISTEQKHLFLVQDICAYLSSPSTQCASLANLSTQFKISPYHLQKVFKSIMGITPKEYCKAIKHKNVKSILENKKSSSITKAIYDSNHASSSRFYEASNSVLGMTPKEYKKGAPNLNITFAIGQCSLGAILVAQTDKGICAILLGDDPSALLDDMQKRFPKANFIAGNKNYEKVMATVVGFIDLTQPTLSLPLDIQGTAFELKVWKALSAIPLGTTANYSTIASAIGSPKSFRAVANACASNKIAVAIPCHRVVKKNGNLSGYRWGLERKKKLLSSEAATVSNKTPKK